LDNRDKPDIATVFDRHFDKVYGYVAYRVAPDFDAARDITQEVFLAAMNGLARFRGDSSMLTWLRALARRKVADHFRRGESQVRFDETYRGLAAAQRHADDPYKAEQALLVGSVMRRLPESHAELLELKYLDGLTVKEIAALQDTTEKAVESALTRARDAFRTSHDDIVRTEETEL
jgi:RNA polymerase sigma-70 factor, ECF subfamily